MQVSELIAELQKYPQDSNVYVMFADNLQDDPEDLELDNFAPTDIVDITDGWVDCKADINDKNCPYAIYFTVVRD